MSCIALGCAVDCVFAKGLLTGWAYTSQLLAMFGTACSDRLGYGCGSRSAVQVCVLSPSTSQGAHLHDDSVQPTLAADVAVCVPPAQHSSRTSACQNAWQNAWHGHSHCIAAKCALKSLRQIKPPRWETDEVKRLLTALHQTAVGLQTAGRMTNNSEGI